MRILCFNVSGLWATMRGFGVGQWHPSERTWRILASDRHKKVEGFSVFFSLAAALILPCK